MHGCVQSGASDGKPDQGGAYFDIGWNPENALDGGEPVDAGRGPDGGSLPDASGGWDSQRICGDTYLPEPPYLGRGIGDPSLFSLPGAFGWVEGVAGNWLLQRTNPNLNALTDPLELPDLPAMVDGGEVPVSRSTPSKLIGGYWPSTDRIVVLLGAPTNGGSAYVAQMSASTGRLVFGPSRVAPSAARFVAGGVAAGQFVFLHCLGDLPGTCFVSAVHEDGSVAAPVTLTEPMAVIGAAVDSSGLLVCEAIPEPATGIRIRRIGVDGALGAWTTLFDSELEVSGAIVLPDASGDFGLLMYARRASDSGTAQKVFASRVDSLGKATNPKEVFAADVVLHMTAAVEGDGGIGLLVAADSFGLGVSRVVFRRLTSDFELIQDSVIEETNIGTAEVTYLRWSVDQYVASWNRKAGAFTCR